MSGSKQSTGKISNSANQNANGPNVYLQGNSGIEVKANNYVDAPPAKGSTRASQNIRIAPN